MAWPVARPDSPNSSPRNLPSSPRSILSSLTESVSLFVDENPPLILMDWSALLGCQVVDPDIFADHVDAGFGHVPRGVIIPDEGWKCLGVDRQVPVGVAVKLPCQVHLSLVREIRAVVVGESGSEGVPPCVEQQVVTEQLTPANEMAEQTADAFRLLSLLSKARSKSFRKFLLTAILGDLTEAVMLPSPAMFICTLVPLAT